MFSLDTETTGIDFHHGAKPFFVTVCQEDLTQTYWEWSVDPMTRQPILPEEDMEQISNLIITSGDSIVGQNLKFDVKALSRVGIPTEPHKFPFPKIHDTLIAGHLLYSNKPHNLTDMAIQYLGVDIEPLEKALEEAVKECRRLAKRDYPSWRIAKEGLPDMPSAKEKTWRYDMWLPRTLAIEMDLPQPNPECNHQWIESLSKESPGHSCRYCNGQRWWIVLSDYSNADSAVTIRLWQEQRKMLEQRKLWKIYLERMKLVPIIYQMEELGIPISRERLCELREQFTQLSENHGKVCTQIANGYMTDESEMLKAWGIYTQFKIPEHTPVDIAADMLAEKGETEAEQSIRNSRRYDLKLPRSGNNKSLTEFCFSERYLNLPARKFGKSDTPSLDKTVMDYYLSSLPEDSVQLKFIKALTTKRKRDTALNFVDSYESFMVPVPLTAELIASFGSQVALEKYCLIYSSLNQTGTDTLRMSMSNPNGQQISKQENINLRYMFGPLPGREWFPTDYENLELRIPGYEAGEAQMIALFEKPDEAPFFGSYHLLNASIVYPDLFNKPICPRCLDTGDYTDESTKTKRTCSPHQAKVPTCHIKGAFKTLYDSTWYQWIKNAGFALIYGCQEAKFDETCKRNGGYAALRKKLPALFRLSEHWIRFAEQRGYVETIPDRAVDPDRGYPILCSRTEWGGISPTIPLNYHVQSTAMWCTSKAMVRIHNFFESLNRGELFNGRRWVYPTTGKYYLVLQVHDELVPDCPVAPAKWKNGPGKGKPSWVYNWPVIRHCRELMEQSGDDIGIPLKVSVSHCALTWSKGEKIKESVANSYFQSV